MKIVLTGGASGGHFTPLMAVAEKVARSAYEQKILQPKIYYFGNSPRNPEMLFERGIVYEHVPSAEMFSQTKNPLTLLKTFFGIFVAIYKLFRIYPDAIFVKGGMDGFSTSLAAFLLQIPIIVHESDSVPGRVTKLVGHFADRVAISYIESSEFFQKKKLAHTGQPILEKYTPLVNFERKYNTNKKKTILITGGSQGSTRINAAVVNILPELLSKYKVIHQCGEANYAQLKTETDAVVGENKDYILKGSLNFSEIYQDVDLCITRGGSTLFELAAWQIPSIIIPLPESYKDHQRENARIQSHLGWSIMLTEENLTPNVLTATLEDILENQNKWEDMSNKAKDVTRLDASKIIADEIIHIGISHHV